jgi:predicted amidohydrolase YtcJ
LPGFIDAHQHPSLAALYAGGVQLVAPAVTDIASLQEALATAARALTPGAWLVAMNWDEARLKERRPPTRLELDDAVPDRPLFALHYTCHRGLANSRALELAGITRGTADPSGGVVSRGSNGEPDGLLIERGMSRVESLARAALCTRDADGFLERLGEHYRALLTCGITRVVDTAVPSDLFRLYEEAERRGLIPLPTVLMPVSTAGYLDAPADALQGPVTGTRQGNLRVGPVKLIVDGAPGCTMCLSWWQTAGTLLSTWAASVRQRSFDPLRLSMALEPRLGRAVHTGISLYRPDELEHVVLAAVERGFAIASHAEGNEAVAMALSAYAAAGPALGRAGMPRFEHVLFADRQQAARIADLGVAVVAQPYFLSLPAFASAPNIPGLPIKPLRWLWDAGVVVAGSSDFPVTHFDPLDGMRAAVQRRDSAGRVRAPEQCLTVEEACTLYTRNAARASGCLDECGTLRAGLRADLVVLDGPLSSPSSLDRARVRGTVVGGEVAFAHEPLDFRPV